MKKKWIGLIIGFVISLIIAMSLVNILSQDFKADQLATEKAANCHADECLGIGLQFGVQHIKTMVILSLIILIAGSLIGFFIGMFLDKKSKKIKK